MAWRNNNTALTYGAQEMGARRRGSSRQAGKWSDCILERASGSRLAPCSTAIREIRHNNPAEEISAVKDRASARMPPGWIPRLAARKPARRLDGITANHTIVPH